MCSTVFSSSSATGMQPFLKYTFSGVLSHSMFSLLSATVLIFSRSITPTLWETELPPQEPQPSVSEGTSLKLYRSPMPPWLEGVFTTILQACILAACSAIFSFSAGSMKREAVWPGPPSISSCSDFFSASAKLFALYMARTGESFSWAKGSEISVLSTSPIRIFVFTGTFTPAISAILYALCPTIFAFTPPLMMTVAPTFRISSPFRK